MWKMFKLTSVCWDLLLRVALWKSLGKKLPVLQHGFLIYISEKSKYWSYFELRGIRQVRVPHLTGRRFIPEEENLNLSYEILEFIGPVNLPLGMTI